MNAAGAGSADAGSTAYRVAIVRVNPANGQRTLLSDFGDPAQGPLGGQFPGRMAIEKSGQILVTDSNNLSSSGGGLLLRIDPASGKRSVVSDFGDANQGATAQFPDGVAVEASGKILVVVPFFKGSVPGGALFRIDPASGQRELLSDFSNAAQGATGSLLRSVAVTANGKILVSDQDVDDFGSGRGAIFQIDPINGQRSVLSDFGDLAQGPGNSPSGLTVVQNKASTSFARFDANLILSPSVTGVLISSGKQWYQSGKRNVLVFGNR